MSVCNKCVAIRNTESYTPPSTYNTLIATIVQCNDDCWCIEKTSTVVHARDAYKPLLPSELKTTREIVQLEMEALAEQLPEILQRPLETPCEVFCPLHKKHQQADSNTECPYGDSCPPPLVRSHTTPTPHTQLIIPDGDGHGTPITFNILSRWH